MTFSGFNFKLIFQLQRLEQEHKMQLHQLENVNRDKKTENGNANTSNSKYIYSLSLPPPPGDFYIIDTFLALGIKSTSSENNILTNYFKSSI